MSLRELSKSAKRNLLAVVLGLGLSVNLIAFDPERCVNCGTCSGSELHCGICVWYMTGQCCTSGWEPDGYAMCSNGEWFAFCQGPGGPYVECGTYNQ
jgi:hypothetical protein